MEALFAFEFRRASRSFTRSMVGVLIMSTTYVWIAAETAAAWMAFPVLLLALVFFALPLRGTVDRTDGTLALLRTLPVSRAEIGVSRTLSLFSLQAPVVAVSGVPFFLILRKLGQPVSVWVVAYAALALFGIAGPLSLLLSALYSAASTRSGIVVLGVSFALAVPLWEWIKGIEWSALSEDAAVQHWLGAAPILLVWSVVAAAIVIGVYGIGLAVQPLPSPRPSKLPPDTRANAL